MSESALLAELIDATPWLDTHEHLVEERVRIGRRVHRFRDGTGNESAIPGDWFALPGDYAVCDLVSAGLDRNAPDALYGDELTPEEKWELVEPYLAAARHTGYWRALDITTERLFGARLSRDTFQQIDEAAERLRRPGYYQPVLREFANVESCQVNCLESELFRETESPALLYQDMSMLALARGIAPAVEELSGIEVADLDDQLRLLEWSFDRYAASAVAVKCQWAYNRPLAVDLDGAPPRTEFRRLRAGAATAGEQRAVEDYLFRRCLDLARAHDLPVKLHLGYLDGNSRPQLRNVFQHVADITPVVQAYPDVTFVLMHIAWPQQEQLLALAKHEPNVHVDLCWAWIVAPLATTDFVQRFLTTVPSTKLLCFGGDHVAVENVVGHAELARRGLQRALERLVELDCLRSEDALGLVPQLMNGNAKRVFAGREMLVDNGTRSR